MIRDNNKDKAYFDEHIALNDTAIAKRLDVETFPNVKGRVGRAYTLVHDAFIGCIYRFSRGDSLEDIRQHVFLWMQTKEIQQRVIANTPAEFKKICEQYTRVTLDTVYDALTMMAFSAALRFTPEETHRLLSAIGHAGKDALMDEAARALGNVNRLWPANAHFRGSMRRCWKSGARRLISVKRGCGNTPPAGKRKSRPFTGPTV